MISFEFTGYRVQGTGYRVQSVHIDWGLVYFTLQTCLQGSRPMPMDMVTEDPTIRYVQNYGLRPKPPSMGHPSESIFDRSVLLGALSAPAGRGTGHAR